MENFIKAQIEWSHFLDKYLISLDNNPSYSRHTKMAYQRDLVDFKEILPLLPKPDPKTSSPEAEFLALYYFCHKSLWARLKPSSQQRKIAALKGFLKFLRKQKVIKQSIEFQMVGPKIPHKIPRYLTVDEAYNCFRLAQNQYAKAPTELLARQSFTLFCMLYFMGLRVSEALAVQWSDFDWSSQSLRVLGKGNKQRLVAFPKILEHLLLPIKNQKPQNHDGYVLTRPITPQKAYKLMRELGIQAQLTKILNPHSLRHSYATHLLSDGIELRVLQDLLGHTSLLATQKYTHLSTDHLAKTVDLKHPLSQKKIA